MFYFNKLFSKGSKPETISPEEEKIRIISRTASFLDLEKAILYSKE